MTSLNGSNKIFSGRPLNGVNSNVAVDSIEILNSATLSFVSDGFVKTLNNQIITIPSVSVDDLPYDVITDGDDAQLGTVVATNLEVTNEILFPSISDGFVTITGNVLGSVPSIAVEDLPAGIVFENSDTTLGNVICASLTIPDPVLATEPMYYAYGPDAGGTLVLNRLDNTFRRNDESYTMAETDALVGTVSDALSAHISDYNTFVDESEASDLAMDLRIDANQNRLDLIDGGPEFPNGGFIGAINTRLDIIDGGPEFPNGGLIGDIDARLDIVEAFDEDATSRIDTLEAWKTSHTTHSNTQDQDIADNTHDIAIIDNAINNEVDGIIHRLGVTEGIAGSALGLASATDVFLALWLGYEVISSNAAGFMNLVVRPAIASAQASLEASAQAEYTRLDGVDDETDTRLDTVENTLNNDASMSDIAGDMEMTVFARNVAQRIATFEIDHGHTEETWADVDLTDETTPIFARNVAQTFSGVGGCFPWLRGLQSANDANESSISSHTTAIAGILTAIGVASLITGLSIWQAIENNKTSTDTVTSRVDTHDTAISARILTTTADTNYQPKETQRLSATDNVTFANITDSGLSMNQLVMTDATKKLVSSLTPTITSLTTTGNIVIGGTFSVSGAVTVNGALITFPSTSATLATTSTSQTLLNKTLTTPSILSIVNSGQTITFPTSTSTLSTLGLAETLVNKTLTSPSISNPTISGTLTSAGISCSSITNSGGISCTTLSTSSTADFAGNTTFSTAPNFTSGTIKNGTSVINLPTSSSTLVTLNETQTLANKTLTAPIVDTITVSSFATDKIVETSTLGLLTSVAKNTGYNLALSASGVGNNGTATTLARSDHTHTNLPTQAVNSTSTPTFASLTLSGLTTNQIVETTTLGLLTSVAKNTGYNLALSSSGGNNGTATTLARSDHTHTNLPTQAVNSTSTPTFASLTLSGLTTNQIVETTTLGLLTSVAKNTGYNLALSSSGGNNGVATTLARSDHSHTNLPTQAVNSTSNPTFASLTLSGLTTGRIVETTAGGLLTSVVKKTGYNLDTGTTSTTLALGNHTHTNLPNQAVDTTSSPTFAGIVTNNIDTVSTLSPNMTLSAHGNVSICANAFGAPSTKSISFKTGITPVTQMTINESGSINLPLLTATSVLTLDGSKNIASSNDLSITSLTTSGDITVNSGSLTVNSGSGTNTFYLRDGSITKASGTGFAFSGAILPQGSTQNIGSSTKPWNNMFVSGNVTMDGSVTLAGFSGLVRTDAGLVSKHTTELYHSPTLLATLPQTTPTILNSFYIEGSYTSILIPYTVTITKLVWQLRSDFYNSSTANGFVVYYRKTAIGTSQTGNITTLNAQGKFTITNNLNNYSASVALYSGVTSTFTTLNGNTTAVLTCSAGEFIELAVDTVVNQTSANAKLVAMLIGTIN